MVREYQVYSADIWASVILPPGWRHTCQSLLFNELGILSSVALLTRYHHRLTGPLESGRPFERQKYHYKRHRMLTTST